MVAASFTHIHIDVTTYDVMETLGPYMKTRGIFLPTEKCPDGLATSHGIVGLELGKKTRITLLLKENKKNRVALDNKRIRFL